MEDKSWLDSEEGILAYYEEWRKKPHSEQERLDTINRMRAQSGDDPLTMEESIQIGEDVKNGIFAYQQYLPKTFFQRLKAAVRRSRAVFVATMRK